MTQDVYFRRKARNTEAASALDKAMPEFLENKTWGKPWLGGLRLMMAKAYALVVEPVSRLG